MLNLESTDTVKTIWANNTPILVDATDYEWLASFRWVTDRGGYARTAVDSGYTYMHRMILDAQKGETVDHINRVRTDNRRANLRIATISQNRVNTPRISKTQRYRGVKQNSVGKYQSKVRMNDITYYLGTYKSEVLAAKVYDAGARIIQGDFALLNFPNIHEQRAQRLAERYIKGLGQARSKTGYIGVRPENAKYSSQVKLKGVCHRVGLFDTPEEAARARDRYIINHKITQLKLNFPREAYET